MDRCHGKRTGRRDRVADGHRQTQRNGDSGKIADKGRRHQIAEERTDSERRQIDQRNLDP
jgi:hypothetical protein